MITDMPLGFAGLYMVRVGTLTFEMRVTLSFVTALSLLGACFAFGIPALYNGNSC